MMKVLYCASVWVHLYNFHLPYIRELENEGFEVHVAANGIPDTVSLSHSHNLPIRKSIFSPRNLYAVIQIALLIRRERFDMIYVHTTLAAFLCRMALLFSMTRIRLIYLCHGYFFGAGKDGLVDKNLKSLFYLLCEKLFSGCTTTLVLMNREDYASASRYRLSEDIRFLHGMGLVPKHYAPATRRRPKDGKIVFLCVGELSARKNQAQALRAFALAHAGIPDSELWFAGGGVMWESYGKLAAELGISQHVRFLGHVQDISAAYGSADVLISASRSEGLPFCVLEGLYFGLPMILSDIKGHRDLVKHGQNGLLYGINDDSVLAEYMLRLGNSREERSRLVSHATLPGEYKIDSVMEEFRQIIGLPVSDRKIVAAASR